MATGNDFEGANDVLGAPKGQEDEVYDLPIFRHEHGFVSCWRLSAEEIEYVKEHGVIWLHVMGRSMPPVFIEGAHAVKMTEPDGTERPARIEPQMRLKPKKGQD